MPRGRQQSVIPPRAPYAGCGARLAQAVRYSATTQTELARKAGVKQSALSRIICGKQALSVELALAIAAVTGVRAGWLLTGELPMRPGESMEETLGDAYQAGWDAALETLTACRELVKTKLAQPKDVGAGEPEAGERQQANAKPSGAPRRRGVRGK